MKKIDIENKFNITETIRAIRKAHEELERSLDAERSVCTPILTDVSLISDILIVFRNQIGNRRMTMNDKRLFVFTIQYLYAPRNLFGRKMPKGLRRAIASALGMNAESVVSDIGNKTLLHYQVYAKFRTDANLVFEGIGEWLKENGFVK